MGNYNSERPPPISNIQIEENKTTIKEYLEDSKKANVVDLNQNTEFPKNGGKKKNKNDFYRFLLSQNQEDLKNLQTKYNNDIFIPRSIMKKNEINAR